MKNLLLTTAFVVATTFPSIAVSQVQAPPIEAYGELPQTENIAISPSGNIAMVTTVDEKRMLLALDSNMKVMNTTLVGDIKVRDIAWVGDETVVLTRSDTQKLGDRFWAESSEFFNAMILPVDPNVPVRTVFADDRKILSSIFGEYGYRKIGDEWYGFYGGIKMELNRGGTYFWSGTPASLFRVRLSDNSHEQISRTPSKTESYDWLVDSKGEIAAELIFYPESDNWRLRNAAGRIIAEGSVENKGSAALRAFGQTPGTALYWTRNDEDADLRWFEVKLDGSSPPQPAFEGSEIHSIRLDPASMKIIGYREEGDRFDEPQDWTFFDPELQTEAGKIYSAFDHVNGSVWGHTPSFSKVIVRTNGNNDSGTWYLIDTVAKNASLLSKSYPEVQPQQVGKISTFSYTAEDGTEMDGILTLPPGKEPKNLPAIMLPHGGPQSHDIPEFDWWAQAFASRGYAVFQPNFRGSTNRDDEFIDAGNGEWGRKMQTDISDGMMALAEEGIVDRSKICIMGASYGGYAAMAGITLQDEIYRCSVSVAGVSDLERFVGRERRETGSKSRMEFREETMGPKEEMDSISPRFLAEKANAPILLIHGRDDTVVPFEQSKVMAEALERAGKPYEFVELEGEDHWLSRSSTRHQMLEAAMKFVLKHNPPQ